MTSLAHVEDGTIALTLGYADEESLRGALDDLVAARVASLIAARDATLWGADAEEEAGKRLAWIDLPAESRALLPRLAELRAEVEAAGLDRVVLCGMGGSSLAPEVICAAAGRPLVVLDASDPDSVIRATSTDLDRTVVVVSSKSGGTVETDSQRRAFEAAFRDAGIDPAERIVVVTDPGSPLEGTAREAGYRVVAADPEVGGRYSALTAFGLVPSALAGVDVAGLLDEAAAARPVLVADTPDNPGLRLGALLGVAGRAGVDKLVLADDGSGLPGLGDWIEQLVAESTGKDGTGLLPVVVGDTTAVDYRASTPDSILASIGPGTTYEQHPPTSGWGAAVDAPLGAQLLLWEVATAVAGRVLGINPFDQPDVESAKQAARQLLDGTPEDEPAILSQDGVEVRALGPRSFVAAVAGAGDLEGAFDALLGALAAEDDRGYLAVMAYVDRHDNPLAASRAALAARTGRPVTFGWGPRFLHSTGQFHKGGPAVGVFLQVTAAPRQDLPIPGRPFGFAGLVAAQAAGDARVLADHDRPVLRLHLRDAAPGSPAVTRLAHLLGIHA